MTYPGDPYDEREPLPGDPVHREEERRRRAADAFYEAWRLGDDPDEAYERAYDADD